MEIIQSHSRVRRFAALMLAAHLNGWRFPIWDSADC